MRRTADPHCPGFLILPGLESDTLRLVERWAALGVGHPLNPALLPHARVDDVRSCLALDLDGTWKQTSWTWSLVSISVSEPPGNPPVPEAWTLWHWPAYPLCLAHAASSGFEELLISL